ALAIANSAPIRKLSAPGAATSSTPQNPTRSAPHRAAPAVSRRISAENSVANSGAEKLIATAPASGISPKALMMKLCAKAYVMPRAARPSRGESEYHAFRHSSDPLRALDQNLLFPPCIFFFHHARASAGRTSYDCVNFHSQLIV